MAGKEDINVIAAHTYKEYENITHTHDIALLRLSRCVSYNDYIQPICISLNSQRKSFMDTTYMRFTAVGWGKTRNQTSSNVLQTVSLKRFPKSKCYENFWNNDTSTQICAGSTTGTDACGGDSGGPLYTSGTWYSGVNRKTQLGIISFGTMQCLGVGMYTNVMSYVEWIERIVMESDIEVVVPQIDFLDGNCISNSTPPADTKSQASAYPWLAHIYMDSFPLALGTLITDRSKVRLGRNIRGATVAIHTVQFVFSHPGFEAFTKNDIALLKLENKVQYTDHIRPICMPFLNNTTPYQKKATEAERLVVIGFSQESSANVQRINSTNCYNGNYQKLKKEQFCFRHPQSVTLASGSPLVRQFLHGNFQAYTLVGMANFGQSDHRGMDVYTDVLSHANWIKYMLM
ncbi:hypothetical protein KR032_008443 [Drosophila birchii]|nr:hypothetical protein KR032_008443 [Drosophila birchii]